MPIPDPLVRKVADALKSVPNGPVNDIWHRGITSDADFDHIARVAVEALDLTEIRSPHWPEPGESIRYVTRWEEADADS